VPRERWRERLLLMRSGGVDVVSSYLIWIHHEPEPGAVSFEGNLDVAGFVALCAELDLQVVLRLGPWVHGELRNGGFPDWVQQAAVQHRTDDPAYLDLVRSWFGRLGKELADRCGPIRTFLPPPVNSAGGWLLRTTAASSRRPRTWPRSEMPSWAAVRCGRATTCTPVA
jgi:hypothetical protein